MLEIRTKKHGNNGGNKYHPNSTAVLQPVNREISHQHVSHGATANSCYKRNDENTKRIEFFFHGRINTRYRKGKCAKNVNDVEKVGFLAGLKINGMLSVGKVQQDIFALKPDY